MFFKIKNRSKMVSNGFALTELLIVMVLMGVLMAGAYSNLVDQGRTTTDLVSDTKNKRQLSRALEIIGKDIRISGSNPSFDGNSGGKETDTLFTVDATAYPFGVNPNPGESHDIFALYTLRLPDENDDGILEYQMLGDPAVPHIEVPSGSDTWVEAWGANEGDKILYRLEARDGGTTKNDLVRVDEGQGSSQILGLNVDSIEIQYFSGAESPNLCGGDPASNCTLGGSPSQANVIINSTGRSGDTIVNPNEISSVVIRMNYTKQTRDTETYVSSRHRKWVSL